MTSGQQRALELVRTYFAEHGRGPTTRWLMRELELRSPAGAHRILVALEGYGFLKRVGHKSGAYIPAEAHRAALASAPTAELLAELQRRAACGDAT